MLQSLLAVSPDWNRATLPIVIHHRMNVLKCLAVLLLAWQAFTVIVLPAMGCCDGASACCTATRLSVSCAACAPAQGPMPLISAAFPQFKAGVIPSYTFPSMPASPLALPWRPPDP